MSMDLEETLEEMGPEYRAVVARLKTSLGAEPPVSTRPAKVVRGWLVAASLLLVVCLAVPCLPRFSGSSHPSPNAPHEYVMSIEEMIATQNADGGWKTDFLTRRNADALKNCGDFAAQVAYKKAVRNLRAHGVL